MAVLFICGTITHGTESQYVDDLQLDWFKVSTLKNVREVYPKVSLEIAEANSTDPNFTAQIGPLTQKDLQKDLEQMLRDSGIKITNKFNGTSANAPLSLNVTIFAKVRDDGPLPAYAIFIYTEAMQPEILLRDNQIRSFSRTWPMVPIGGSVRALILSTPDTIIKDVTNEVTKQVTNFIIDYSAANPGKRITIPKPQKQDNINPDTEENTTPLPTEPSA